MYFDWIQSISGWCPFLKKIFDRPWNVLTLLFFVSQLCCWLFPRLHWLAHQHGPKHRPSPPKAIHLIQKTIPSHSQPLHKIVLLQAVLFPRNLHPMTHCYAFKLGIKFLHLLSKCLTAVRFALTPCEAKWYGSILGNLVSSLPGRAQAGATTYYRPFQRRRVCFPAHLSWGDQRDRCCISWSSRLHLPHGTRSQQRDLLAFASMTIPRNFIIDQEGKIVVCEVGYTPGKLTDMIGQVENLLK